MRYFSGPFYRASFTTSGAGRIVLKIDNDTQVIYIKSHDDIVITDPGSAQFGGMTSASGESQELSPERGISTIGQMSVGVSDPGFESLLESIDAAGDSIYNNKAQIFYGYADIDFDDYAYAPPMYVSEITNTDLEYTIGMSDPQRFLRREIFNAQLRTRCVGSLGTTTGTLTVEDTTGFELTAHDAGWSNAPSDSAGYLQISGTDDNGKDIIEWMRYDSKTSSTFNIVERGVFGTAIVDILGSDDDGNSEVTELVYLDLPAPKLLIALMTGSLYGQVGQFMPDTWHASVSADKFNLPSFENIGQDVWDQRLVFIGEKSQDAKFFIYDQILRVFNLGLRIDQDGQLSLFRASSIPSKAAGVITYDYTQITDLPTFNRSTENLRNNLLIRWEYRADEERFARNNFFVDSDSIDKNNYTSTPYNIDLRGLRGSGRDELARLHTIADNMRGRFSMPTLTPSITVPIAYALGLSVGDIVSLNLDKHPDYASATGKILSSFEVQGISYDFVGGRITLRLFSTAGTTDPLPITDPAIPSTIDTTGFTLITSVLTGSDSGGVFTITSSQNLPEGDYFYNGIIRTNPAVTVTFNGSTRILHQGFEILGTGKWDGKGRGGTAGSQGYFGGGDATCYGIEMEQQFDDFAVPKFRDRLDPAIYSGLVPAGLVSVPVPYVYVDADNTIKGLPAVTAGNGSGEGGEAYDIEFGTSTPGAAGASGGAGLHLIGDYVDVSTGGIVDTSGADGSPGTQTDVTRYDGSTGYNLIYHSGSSGYGWPGALIITLTDNLSPLPDTTQFHVAKTGKHGDDFIPDKERPRFLESSFTQIDEDVHRVGNPVSDTGVFSFGDYQFGLDNGTASVVHRIGQTVEAEPIEGVEPPVYAKAPSISITENINTPRTSEGTATTLEITATAQPGDSAFEYALFEYRLPGKKAWIPMPYKTATEASIETVADGRSIEFSARGVNKYSRISNDRTTTTFATTIVNRNPEQSESNKPGADPSIQVPGIKRLELVNRLDDDTQWDKYKSPSAHFKWAMLSNNYGGDVTNPYGVTDLHLAGYKIRIFDTLDNLRREEEVSKALYTYDYDRNKRDGDGVPVRSFRVQVSALTTTGFESEPTSITVSNPAPAAPANVQVGTSYNSITITFDLPSDADFVGVDVYSLLGASGDPYSTTPVRITGNQITFNNLTPGATYQIGLTSVDQFGAGDSVAAFGVSVPKITATDDVDGLSNWATEIDPVDAAFVAANVGNDAITSTQIASLAAGKILAGTVAVAVDIGSATGVRLDGATGTVTTLNTGYQMTMGAVSVPGESANPLTLFAKSGSNYPFWIDSSGDFKFGVGDQTLSFSGGVISWGDDVSFGNTADRSVVVADSGGDFTSVDAALLELSKYIISYKDDGVSKIIYIDTDNYTMYDEITVDNVDLSGISIQKLPSAFNAAVQARHVTSNATEYHFMVVKNNARAPKIEIDINLTSSNTFSRLIEGYSGAEIYVDSTIFSTHSIAIDIEDSKLYLGDNSGLTNNGTSGNKDVPSLNAENSSVRLQGVTLSGSGMIFNLCDVGGYIKDMSTITNCNAVIDATKSSIQLDVYSGTKGTTGTLRGDTYGLLFDSCYGSITTNLRGWAYAGAGGARGCVVEGGHMTVGGDFRYDGATSTIQDLDLTFGGIGSAKGYTGGNGSSDGTGLYLG